MSGISLYLDAGSTNTRGWLVRDRHILSRATASIGVRDSAREGSTARLRSEIARLIAELSAIHSPVRVMAAGMITSSLGVKEVPHLVAPAGLEAFSKGLAKIEEADVTTLPMYFVPGVRTGTAEMSALDTDIMRGEETLALGLLACGQVPPGGAFLNAGSHWKLISINRAGEVAGSRTTLGGEVVHAVQTTTILASALPTGPLSELVEDAVRAGADAVRTHGLLRTLFGIRLMEQRGEHHPEWRFSFGLGAFVASDLDALLAEGVVRLGDRLAITGPGAVPQVWAMLLRRAGCDAVVLGPADIETAFIAGLSAIESHALGDS
ncbi:MAG: 2-dehydro-3-deoxygalactonokinase [Vicinamibacteria bacterium]